jgi:hypothetical protein
LCQDQTFHEQLSTVLFHKALIWTVLVPNKAPHYEDVWENGGIVPHTLNLSTKWQLAVSFAHWMLCHMGKNKQYQLQWGRQVSQPQCWSINCRETYISCPWWDLNLNYLYSQPSQDCDNYYGVQSNLNSKMLQVTKKYN